MAKQEEVYYATGRRKTSGARVYLTAAKEETPTVTVNNRPLENYFPLATTQMVIRQPLELTENLETFDIKIRVTGGGPSGQAGAVRHGISRALEKFQAELRAPLKNAGLRSRDPRAVERKKAGRHKARKKPQFSKR